MTAILAPQPTTTAFDLARLYLVITNMCQLECAHCYARSGPDGDHGTMTVLDWRRVLDEAAGIGTRWVQLIGGEPTLHPGLVPLIHRALSLDMEVEVFTNLVRVTPEQWTAFQRPGVSLATSWYSDQRAEHQTITGRDTHRQTLGNVRKARELGIHVRAGVIDVRPGQRIGQARNTLVELGVPSIGTDKVRSLGRACTSIGGNPAALCGACGLGTAAVQPDGRVTPCQMSSWFEVGNVHRMSLGEAVASMPAARQTLAAQGMPLRVDGGCRPGSGGGSCYPQQDYQADQAGCRPGPCSPNSGTDCYPAQD